MDLPSGHSVVIDVNEYVRLTPEKWINYTLTPVNDCLLRLGIFEGEFHWHHHDDEDEVFFVLSGELILDVEDESFRLGPNQGYTVPRGVEHRTRAEVKTVCLMIEGNTVDPKGD